MRVLSWVMLPPINDRLLRCYSLLCLLAYISAAQPRFEQEIFSISCGRRSARHNNQFYQLALLGSISTKRAQIWRFSSKPIHVHVGPLGIVTKPVLRVKNDENPHAAARLQSALPRFFCLKLLTNSPCREQVCCLRGRNTARQRFDAYLGNDRHMCRRVSQS